jgi:hypothetical protein
MNKLTRPRPGESTDQGHAYAVRPSSFGIGRPHPEVQEYGTQGHEHDPLNDGGEQTVINLMIGMYVASRIVDSACYEIRLDGAGVWKSVSPLGHCIP